MHKYYITLKVVYIRKVKKSESKSQQWQLVMTRPLGCVYP